jgi:type II secretory pathway pseudopilin PulG
MKPGDGPSGTLLSYFQTLITTRFELGFKRDATRGGFTLIEVMVAVFILMFATIGIVPFYLSTLGHSSTIRYRSLATNIARERMEEIRQLDYREVIVDSGAGKTLAERFGTTTTVRGIDFDVSYEIGADVDSEGGPKDVTVMVTWSGPPPPSPASVTTTIYQQYLGPRGAVLDVVPHTVETDSPYWRVESGASIRYYIAEEDWGLIFSNLAQPSTSMRDVYARYGFCDDDGNSIPIGPPADDYRLGTTYLHYSTDSNGALTKVWFQWPLDLAEVPDGRWELRAVAYNIYDQPGNSCSVGVRVETGPPAKPANFVAQPQVDNQTINLYWENGPERDRAYVVLERSIFNLSTGNWGPFSVLNGHLDPDANSYIDQGSVSSQTHPWGSSDVQNRYQ